MNAESIVVAVLLGAAVVILWLCCLGVLLFRDTFERLHCLGPAATLAPVLIVAAVLVHHSSLQACIKVVLIAGALFLISPVLTHVTARAERVRRVKHLDLRDDETAVES